MDIEYIGKTLLVDKKVLVIGDLHLGYEGSLRNSGVMIPVDLYKQVIEDFEEIMEKLGKVEKIIVLGDLKHEFGRILPEEWEGIVKFLEHVRANCEELIIIEGNHDKILFPILKKLGIKGEDFYFWKDFAFFHGDKESEEINDEKIKHWVMGHGHPAITLQDEIKKEKYKCFLEGKYNNKKVIIVPSFFPLIEGTDPRDFSMGFAWDFKLDGFGVKLVGENLEVLDFGKLRDLD